MNQNGKPKPGPLMLADRVAVLRELHDLTVLVAQIREQELAAARRLDDAVARIDEVLGRVRGQRREFSVRVGAKR